LIAKKARTSFLQKRSKKLVLVFGHGRFNQHGLNDKSFFCFFFRVPMTACSSALSESGRAVWFKEEDSSFVLACA
jgi:hypothetical protein